MYADDSISYPDGSLWSDNYGYRLGFSTYNAAVGFTADVETFDQQLSGYPYWNSVQDPGRYRNNGSACGFGHHSPQWGNVGTDGAYAVMQGDGNFVLYGSNNMAGWATNTSGNYPGAFIALQNDGNLVVYTAGGVPIWSFWGRIC